MNIEYHIIIYKRNAYMKLLRKVFLIIVVSNIWSKIHNGFENNSNYNHETLVSLVAAIGSALDIEV